MLTKQEKHLFTGTCETYKFPYQLFSDTSYDLTLILERDAKPMSSTLAQRVRSITGQRSENLASTLSGPKKNCVVVRKPLEASDSELTNDHEMLTGQRRGTGMERGRLARSPFSPLLHPEPASCDWGAATGTLCGLAHDGEDGQTAPPEPARTDKCPCERWGRITPYVISRFRVFIQKVV